MTAGMTKYITCPSCGRECQANPQGHVNCGWCMALLAFNSETEEWEVEISADPVRLEEMKQESLEPQSVPRTTAEAIQMAGVTENRQAQQRFLDRQLEQRRQDSLVRPEVQAQPGGVTTTPVTSLTTGLPTEFTPGLDRGALPQTPEPAPAPVAEAEAVAEPEPTQTEEPSEEFKPIRIHQLAKELGLKSIEVASVAVKEGIITSTGRSDYLQKIDAGQVSQLLTALGVK